MMGIADSNMASGTSSCSLILSLPETRQPVQIWIRLDRLDIAGAKLSHPSGIQNMIIAPVRC